MTKTSRLAAWWWTVTRHYMMLTLCSVLWQFITTRISVFSDKVAVARMAGDKNTKAKTKESQQSKSKGPFTTPVPWPPFKVYILQFQLQSIGGPLSPGVVPFERKARQLENILPETFPRSTDEADHEMIYEFHLFLKNLSLKCKTAKNSWTLKHFLVK